MELQKWRSYQKKMSQQVVLQDDFTSTENGSSELTLVGGVDISFQKNGKIGAEKAVAALVVLTFPGMKVVYEDFEEVDLNIRYKAGFLGFRECPSYERLIERVSKTQYNPQIILVDGFGILHPRRCGCASHLGVEIGYPTIGVAKNLLHTDGLDHDKVLAQTRKFLNNIEKNKNKQISSTKNFSSVGSSSSTSSKKILSPDNNKNSTNEGVLLDNKNQNQKEKLLQQKNTARNSTGDKSVVEFRKIDSNQKKQNKSQQEVQGKIDANQKKLNKSQKEVQGKIDANQKKLNKSQKEVWVKIDANQKKQDTSQKEVEETLLPKSYKQVAQTENKQTVAKKQNGQIINNKDVKKTSVEFPKTNNAVTKNKNKKTGYDLQLNANNGEVLGAALFGHCGTRNPIFVSQGHRVSLQSSLEIVRACCLHRIPEPIRQADLRSRRQVKILFEKHFPLPTAIASSSQHKKN